MNCPKCAKPVIETKGSPVSPYINTYRCTSCGWSGLKCGNSACSGYLEPEAGGLASTVRYNCTTCGWTGTGVRYVA